MPDSYGKQTLEEKIAEHSKMTVRERITMMVDQERTSLSPKQKAKLIDRLVIEQKEKEELLKENWKEDFKLEMTKKLDEILKKQKENEDDE